MVILTRLKVAFPEVDPQIMAVIGFVNSLLVQQWFNSNNAEDCQCDVLLGEECTCHTLFGIKNCQDIKEMELHPITIRELVHPGEILQTETQPSSLPVKLVEVRNNNSEVILYT